MVGRRLLYFMEILLLLTLFAFFTSFVITTNQNDVIVDATEDFTELIRYKGAVTETMYEDFLNQMPTTVKVSFVIDKDTILDVEDEPLSQDYSQEVLEALDSIGYYAMNVGDQVKVIVRKTSPTLFDKVTEMLTGHSSGDPQPIIAIKGGLVLNEQYHLLDEG